MVAISTAIVMCIVSAMAFFTLGYFIGLQQGWEDKRIEPVE